MSTNYNTTEEWRDISEYEGYYQVSNHGRVRSLNRVASHKRHGSQYYAGKILTHGLHRTGYRHVILQKGGKRNVKQVHRLVLIAFAELQPTVKHECNHKNGIKDDNHVSNLEWATRSENIKHSYRKLNRNPNITNAKIAEDDVKKIRELYATGNYYYRELGEMFNITISNIGFIVNRETWRHID